MSEKELLNLQYLVGNYLNGFKIVSVEKDPFIKGQINLFTDSTEDIGFGDRSVIKFWIRDEKSNIAICREQINKDTWILTEFEKWLEEKLTILNEALEDTELDEEIRDCALDRKTMLDKCFYKLIRLKDEVNNDEKI